jgi:hypothetical protein
VEIMEVWRMDGFYDLSIGKVLVVSKFEEGDKYAGDILVKNYQDLVSKIKEINNMVELTPKVFFNNDTILTVEEIRFIWKLKLREPDTQFVIEVMERFKSMGRVDNIETIMLNFISTIKSYIKTKLKKECIEKGLSPIKETFKLLVSDIDNLGVYFGIGEVAYIKKLINKI